MNGLNLTVLGERVSARELYQDYGEDVTDPRVAKKAASKDRWWRRGRPAPKRVSNRSGFENTNEVAERFGRACGLSPGALRTAGVELARYLEGLDSPYAAPVVASANAPVVFALWRAGIPARVGKNNFSMASYLVRGRFGCPRLDPEDAAVVHRPWARLGASDAILFRVPRRDLRRLARLPSDEVQAALASDIVPRPFTTSQKHPSRHRVDWPAINARLADIRKLPLDLLRGTHAPPGKWLRWYKLSDEYQDHLRLLGRVVKSVPLLRRTYSKQVASVLLSAFVPTSVPIGLASWGRLFKRGWVDKYVAPCIARGEVVLGGSPDPDAPNVSNYVNHYVTTLAELPADAKIPEQVACSPSAIQEWAENAGFWLGESAKDTTEHREQAALCRAYDRAAQREPEWAILKWGGEYRRGKKLAKVLKPALDFLVKKAEEGACLFVHGRDADIINELLRRRGVATRHAITSRPLTTQCATRNPDFDAYLRRLAGTEGTVVHVDTGFAGSIPEWMKRAGFPVSEVCLLSTPRPEYQIPGVVEAAGSEGALRTLVLQDIEHSPQRLHKSTKWCPGARLYSDAAPGFWARLYGVCDELGLPRKAGKLKRKKRKSPRRGLAGFGVLHRPHGAHVMPAAHGGKRVYIDEQAGRVYKRAPSSAPEKHCRIAKQSDALLALARLGFATPCVHDRGEDRYSCHEYVCGPTLAEVAGSFTAAQRAGLKSLQRRQRKLGVYVSDLHGRNLVWAGDKRGWVIVDGSFRKKRPEPLAVKLAAQRAEWGL